MIGLAHTKINASIKHIPIRIHIGISRLALRLVHCIKMTSVSVCSQNCNETSRACESRLSDIFVIIHRSKIIIRESLRGSGRWRLLLPQSSNRRNNDAGSRCDNHRNAAQTIAVHPDLT